MAGMTNRNDNLYDVVIIGGGPAGLTAAIYLARACYRIVVVEKEKFGGQITLTEEIVNFPGVIRSSGEHLTGQMKIQGEQFGAEYLETEALNLDTQGDIKTVRTPLGELRCFGILLATGAHPRVLGFEGEEKFRGRGIAYCATCDGEFFTGKEVFVIGGGFAAAQESVFLTKYAKQVTILIREEDFTCAKAVADQARSQEKIRILTQVEVEKVEGDTVVRSIMYRNLRTGEQTVYQAQEGDFIGVFVFVGYEPATALVKDLVELSEQGYVVTDRNQKTCIDGLYAAGDICVKSLRQVVTAVGDGALAATELERYASQMQKKTGLRPIRPKEENSEQKEPEEGEFQEDIRNQLGMVFEKMEHPMILRLFLDESALSHELKDYMMRMMHLTDKLSVETESAQAVEGIPCVRICRMDGIWTGLAFHGVPGGEEFSSFVIGLYNAAGKGQEIEPELAGRIARITRPVHIRIMVSLSCSMCPSLVIAAQKIAAMNVNVTADVYDIAHFKNLQEQYQIMSVPCMVINDGKPYFGKKTLAQVLDLIDLE